MLYPAVIKALLLPIGNRNGSQEEAGNSSSSMCLAAANMLAAATMASGSTLDHRQLLEKLEGWNINAGTTVHQTFCWLFQMVQGGNSGGCRSTNPARLAVPAHSRRDVRLVTTTRLQPMLIHLSRVKPCEVA
jgi:hypothetical protein